MKLLISIILIGIIACFNIQAQPWLHENIDLASHKDVKSSFYEFWGNKKGGKGTGWKPYKRTEYFMDSRVLNDGTLPSKIYWEEFLKEQKKSEIETDKSTWTLIGPNTVPTVIGTSFIEGIGRINCIAIHPTNNNTLYAGAASGGVWRSTNGGTSWLPVSDNLPGGIAISDIEIDPNNPQIIYIATGDGDPNFVSAYSAGVLKSTDGGTTWNSTSINYQLGTYIIRKIVIHPSNSNIVLVASNEGVLYSTDALASYNPVQTGNFKDIEFQPNNPQIVYAAQASPNGLAGIYKSTNGGSSFSQVTNGLPASGVTRIELAVCEAVPTNVYALLCSSVTYGLKGVYKSTNSGDSWTQITGASPNLLGWSSVGSDQAGQGWYDLTIEVSPTNENEIYVGGVNIWKTINSGQNWNLLVSYDHYGSVPYLHADHHWLMFHGNTLFAGHDGGLAKTTDNGNTWQDLSEGLAILQIYDIAVHPTNGKILVGSQDNGTIIYSQGSWQRINQGDGMSVLFDYEDESIMYISEHMGKIFKSTNGGSTYFDIQPSGSGDGAWAIPFEMSLNNTKHIYAGYKTVYKSIDAGETWTPLTANISGNENLLSISICKASEKYIYTSSPSGAWASSNGGTSWQNIKPQLPSGVAISSILVADNSPLEIWLSLSGFVEGEKIYYSSNGGTSWTNISAGLPNVPVNCLVFESNSLNAVYAGTDLGVYYKNATLDQWQGFNSQLPRVIIQSLQIDYNNGKLIAGTYGRGVWAANLYTAANMPPAAHFYANQTTVTVGQSVNFINTSYRNPSGLFWEFEGGSPATSTANSPTVTFSSSGIYSVSLTATNANGSTQYTENQYIIVHQGNATYKPATNLTATLSGANSILNWQSPTAGEWSGYVELGEQYTILTGGPERATLFDDAILGFSYPLNITALRHIFFDNSVPWPDATFKFKIYGSNGSTLLYESPNLEAVSSWTEFFEYNLPNPIQVSEDFYIAIAPVHTSSNPQSGAKLVALNSTHSVYGAPDNWVPLNISNNGYELMTQVYIQEIGGKKWVNNKALDGYKIYRNTELLASISNAEQLNYTDAGIGSGMFKYYVSALYSGNEALPSNTATVWNNTNIPPVVSVGNNLIINELTTTTLNATATDSDGDQLTFEWITPSGITLQNSTTNSAQFTAPEVSATSYFNFLFRAFDGMVYSSANLTVTVNNFTDIQKLEFVEKCLFYPNPASDKLFVEISVQKMLPVSIQLFDIYGRLLISKEVDTQTGNNNIEIDTQNLAAGTYMLKISTGNKFLTERVVIN